MDKKKDFYFTLVLYNIGKAYLMLSAYSMVDWVNDKLNRQKKIIFLALGLPPSALPPLYAHKNK